MPYHIINKEGRFCIAKSGSDTPIKGGCHSWRAEAQAHLTALNINVVKREAKEKGK